MQTDQIIARGATAARLLSDADLMSFFEEVQTDIQSALFNTSFEQAEDRESLYHQHRGVEEILATMRMYATRSEELIRSYSES